MNMHLAAYTAPQNGSPGLRWVWNDRLLAGDVLNAAYVVASAAAGKVTSLGELGARTVAGLACVDGIWVVAYRFRDGGRDSRGRLGRFILAAAFFRRTALGLNDVSAIFSDKRFTEIDEQPPLSMTMEIAAQPVTHDPGLLQNLLRDGAVDLQGNDALSQGCRLCAALPPDCAFHLMDRGQQVQVTMTAPTVAPAPSRSADAPPKDTSTAGIPGWPAPKPGVWAMRMVFMFVGLFVGFGIGVLIEKPQKANLELALNQAQVHMKAAKDATDRATQEAADTKAEFQRYKEDYPPPPPPADNFFTIKLVKQLNADGKLLVTFEVAASGKVTEFTVATWVVDGNPAPTTAKTLSIPLLLGQHKIAVRTQYRLNGKPKTGEASSTGDVTVTHDGHATFKPDPESGQ